MLVDLLVRVSLIKLDYSTQVQTNPDKALDYHEKNTKANCNTT